MTRLNRQWRGVFVLAAVALMPALVWAGDSPLKGRNIAGNQGQAVDLFAGVQDGKLAVQLIPRNEMQGRLMITNKTDQPVTVKLPESFAGVPVLAQPAFPPFAPNNNNRFPNNQNNNPNNNILNNVNAQAPQRVGGGTPSSTFLDIAPEAVRPIKVDTVCLDHGHRCPQPAMKYDVQPVSTTTDKEGVAEVCELLGRREISHRAAQLAAWHLNNGMSWKALAGLRTKQAIGSVASYSPQEIAAAQKAVERALDMHSKRQPDAAKPSANSSATKS